MHKFFTPKELINGNVGKIIGDDVKHIYKVFRITEGEKVVLNNCEGIEYLGKLSTVNKQEVLVDIIRKVRYQIMKVMLKYIYFKDYQNLKRWI